MDWYAPKHPVLKRIGSFSKNGRSKAALAARADEIPYALVQAMPLRSLWWKWIQRSDHMARRFYERALQADAAFTRAAAHLDLPSHNAYFGYSYMSLEMLEVERRQRNLTIVDQIDPGPVEFRLVADEMARYPEIAGLPAPYPVKYYARLRQEWKLTDVIVVNSEWSREAIIAEGADQEKIAVVPLAYESGEVLSHGSAPLRRQYSTAPLRVLWLGQVNVRKGIKYLIDAARLLVNENVHFDVVGAIRILPGAVASAPRNMTFHGPVSRNDAAERYRAADVFVLPTLSDGFALTQLEALAHGIPVVTTSNCGRVVEDGKTGYIVPARDHKALAEAILRFLGNPELAGTMTTKCRETAAAYSIDAYAERLVEVIQKHLPGRRPRPANPIAL